jgi:hypothetical protein
MVLLAVVRVVMLVNKCLYVCSWLIAGLTQCDPSSLLLQNAASTSPGG